MNKINKFLSILSAISLLAAACNAQTVQISPEQANTPVVVFYDLMIGKSLSDKEVADFITRNGCFSSNQFQLCKDTGVAFWTASNQVVKTVYLYSGNADGFKRYQGKLPYKLSFYDPMWKVEEKLKELDIDEMVEPNQKAGVADEAGSPDHIHYWVTYKRLGVTVVYDSPGADPDAYIYAVLISE